MRTRWWGVDLRLDSAGDVAFRLAPFSLDANRELIRTAYRKTEFLGDVPEAVIEAVATCPEGLECARAN